MATDIHRGEREGEEEEEEEGEVEEEEEEEEEEEGEEEQQQQQQQQSLARLLRPSEVQQQNDIQQRPGPLEERKTSLKPGAVKDSTRPSIGITITVTSNDYASRNERIAIPRGAWMPLYLQQRTLVTFAVVLFVLMILLAVSFAFSKLHHGLATTSSQLHYLWTYIPTALFTILSAFWVRLEYRVKALMPWKTMATRPQTAEKSVLLDYVSEISFQTLWTSARARHFVVTAAVAGSLVLSVLLIVSSGLFSLETVTLLNAGARLVATSTFNLSGFEQTEFQHYTSEQLSKPEIQVYSYFAYNQSLPAGSTAEYAFQTFSSTSPAANTTLTGEVDVFTADLDCQPGKLHPVTDPQTEHPSTIAEIDGQSCFKIPVPPTSMLSMSGDFLVDLSTECSNNGSYFFTYALGAGSCPGNCTFEDLQSAVFMVCQPVYAISKGLVTFNTGNGTEVLAPVISIIPNTSVPSIASISNGMLEDLATSTCTSAANEWICAGAGFAATDIFAYLNATMPQLNVTRFVDYQILQESSHLFFRAWAAQWAQWKLLVPAQDKFYGASASEESRLVVQSLSLAVMEALLGLLILLTLFIYTETRDLYLYHDPNSIGGLAVYLARSEDFVQAHLGLGADSLRTIRQHLGAKLFETKNGLLSVVGSDIGEASVDTSLAIPVVEQPPTEFPPPPPSITIVEESLPEPAIEPFTGSNEGPRATNPRTESSGDPATEHSATLLYTGPNNLFINPIADQNAHPTNESTAEPTANRDRDSTAEQPVMGRQAGPIPSNSVIEKAAPKLFVMAKTEPSSSLPSVSESHEEQIAEIKSDLKSVEVVDWYIPFTMSRPFGIGLVVILVLLIASLLSLNKYSESHNGIVDLSPGEFSHYAYTYIPTFTFVVLGQVFGSLDFSSKMFQPYHVLQSGHAPAAISIMENFLDKTSLEILLIAATWKHQYPIIGLTVASIITPFLTIIVSRMLRSQEALHTYSATFKQTSSFSTSLGSNGTQSQAFTLPLDLVLFHNFPDPAWTYNNLALPEIELTSSEPNMTITNETLVHIRLPALRGRANCTQVPESDITMAEFQPVDGWIVFNATGAPQGCDLPSSNGFGAVFPYDGDSFYFPALLAAPNSYFGHWYDVYDQATTFSGNLSHCPWIWAFFGYVTGHTTTDLTAMLCSPFIEEVQVDATFDLPTYSLDVAHAPPVPDETTAKFHAKTSLYNLDNGLLDQAFGNVNIDAFFTAVSESRNGIVPADLLGQGKVPRLIEAIENIYGQAVAQALNAGRSEPTSAPVLLNGTISTPNRRRLVQNPASTYTLVALLVVLLLCTVITFVMMDVRQLLPKNPCSIAAVTSLLAGSGMLSLDVVLEGSHVLNDMQLREKGVFEGWVFGLGWWDTDGGHRNRFGIDIRVYDDGV